jgi:hypothetical protein
MVRATNINTVQYGVGQIPDDAKDLPQFLTTELFKIKSAIDALAAGHLDKSYAAPAKPREGDIRYADGTTWNPGSGQGIYAYYGSAWHFLG